FSNGAMQTITGGEPMLWQEQLTDWMNLLKEGEPARDPYTEIETNGTIQPKDDFFRWINHWNCSPKLESAGDPLEKRYKPDVLKWINDQESSMFKFVVNVYNKNTIDKDLEEIDKIQTECNISTSKISLMAEGYTREQCLSNMISVIEICKSRGFRFSPRLHVYAWDRVTGV
ncbi:MAG TPA: hypothetical protein VNX68_08515, partial [Nitrosopumilaceae archaeon]|nr:hypothetical protein [Nitrosopumilaceae archaeon]